MKEDSGQVSPVAEPGLTVEARRRLAGQVDDDVNAAAAAAGCGGLVVSSAGLIVSVVLHFVTGLSWWWAGGSAIGAAAILVVTVVTTSVIEVSSGTPDPLDRSRDRIVEPADLDDSAVTSCSAHSGPSLPSSAPGYMPATCSTMPRERWC